MKSVNVTRPLRDSRIVEVFGSGSIRNSIEDRGSTMQGYQGSFEQQQEQRDRDREETIVVDLVPPQYQLSPPNSPTPTRPSSGGGSSGSKIHGN